MGSVVVVHGLSWSMWDLSSPTRNRTRPPPTLGAWSLDHWTTREGSLRPFCSIEAPSRLDDAHPRCREPSALLGPPIPMFLPETPSQTPRIIFNLWSGHPKAKSNWHIKLTITTRYIKVRALAWRSETSLLGPPASYHLCKHGKASEAIWDLLGGGLSKPSSTPSHAQLNDQSHKQQGPTV